MSLVELALKKLQETRRAVGAERQLRNFMLRNMPAFMVPAVFVMIDSLPLTPNGKIDRRALPDQSLQTLNPAKSCGTDNQSLSFTEQVIADIWRELLNLDHVDINDDFFDLGGHSLAAVRLFSRIERQFDVRLSPAIILQAPTIAQLAQYVRNDRPISDGHVLIPIQTAGHGTPFFLVHGIGGGLIGYRDLVNNLGKDRPIYGLQAIGLNNQDALDQSVEEMASHYIKAILSFQPKGPYLLGGYCFGGVIAYQMACQLEKRGEQTKRYNWDELLASRKY